MTDDLHHLAAAYALDALDVDERRAFEAHYPTCEICNQEVADFREVAGALAASTAEQPSTDLKARVMAEVGQTRQLAPQVVPRSLRPGRRGVWAVAAAAAAFVLLAGIAAVSFRETANDRVAEVAAAADLSMTELDSTADAAGDVQVLWSPRLDKAAVIGNNLVDVSSDQAYALWFVFGDGSVSPAGLFQTTDGSFRDVLDVDDFEPVAWGLSIEPATGSLQPTTDVIFAGNLTTG